VIEYVGRKQRHKPVDLVLRALYRFGYRTVFLADDNFTVYRARAKELLAAIQEWNARQTDGRVRFTTQISIDAAGDTEMLEMCADAGLTHVFIGIETPNEVSLREAKKRQNLKRNLLDEIQRIVNYGISVDCGMIVGFDNDEVDIFRRQYEFAMGDRRSDLQPGRLGGAGGDAAPRPAGEGRPAGRGWCGDCRHALEHECHPQQDDPGGIVRGHQMAVQLDLSSRRF
jgi:Radical SAM superfamily